MKHETRLRVENLMNNLQPTLEALDELKEDGFYQNQIKFHGNNLIKEIEKMYSKSFKNDYKGNRLLPQIK